MSQGGQPCASTSLRHRPPPGRARRSVGVCRPAGRGLREHRRLPDERGLRSLAVALTVCAAERRHLAGQRHLVDSGSAPPEVPTPRRPPRRTSPTTRRPGWRTRARCPGSTPRTPTSREAPLLVSTDRTWAIPDTGISRDEEHSGQLVVYSVDLRRRPGDRHAPAHRRRPACRPLGWAFDPQKPEALRVVDSQNRVWMLDVSGGKAQARTAPWPREPWVFTDGFNHNTGEPYVESITSDGHQARRQRHGRQEPDHPRRRHRARLRQRRAGQAAARVRAVSAAAFTDAHRHDLDLLRRQRLAAAPTTCPRTASSGSPTASRARPWRRSRPASGFAIPSH